VKEYLVIMSVTGLSRSNTGLMIMKMHLDKKTNSGALVRQRTIPTERLSLVDEVSANISG
jgi:hypothetical protein